MIFDPKCTIMYHVIPSYTIIYHEGSTRRAPRLGLLVQDLRPASFYKAGDERCWVSLCHFDCPFLSPKPHVYVHTYIHACIRTYITLHACIRTYITLHACIRTNIRTYIRTYVRTYICTCMHAYIIIRVCMHPPLFTNHGFEAGLVLGALTASCLVQSWRV